MPFTLDKDKDKLHQLFKPKKNYGETYVLKESCIRENEKKKNKKRERRKKGKKTRTKKQKHRGTRDRAKTEHDIKAHDNHRGRKGTK